MPSSPGELLDRHDPAAWTRSLAYRHRSELPFDPSLVEPEAAVMPDTTVYIDGLKAPGLPAPILALLTSRVVLHCAIACAELAISVGHLDPAHPLTPTYRTPLIDTLSRVAGSRVVAPSADAWTEAALMAGILARTQAYQRENRRALLNDALLLLTAHETGTVLISRNIRHMDLLLRLKPEARVVLYDRPS